MSFEFYTLLFEKTILSMQKFYLEHWLGPSYRANQEYPTPWVCPRCISQYGFKRRGSRKRTLKTSHSKVCFRLLQLTCNDCNKTFSPFPNLLRIGSMHRLTKELEQKLCTVVKDLSYAKTTKIFNMLFELDLSPTTVHRTIQKNAKKAVIVENKDHISCLQTDSTKIKASSNKRGIDVHLAIVIGPSEKKGRRTIRQKNLAVIQVAKKPSAVKKLLIETPVDQLLVDGNSGVEKFVKQKKLATVIQRCLWHIPRTAAHMMYLDGLSTIAGVQQAKALSGFLFDESLSVKEKLLGYDAQIKKYKAKNFDSTSTFLENARMNLFTYKQFDDQDIFVRTNSVIERLMREVNRRMENGSRWTPQGAQNLLTLKFIEELNPESYQYLWKSQKLNNNNFSVRLC
jgi:hypothetical protein